MRLDGFWIGKYEVTIGQYRKFLQDGGTRLGVDWKDEDCSLGKGGSHALSGNKFGSSDNQPMVEVTWHGAKAFAVWLSGKTGKRLRLPTEAQWKYACRSGGKPEKYAGGGSVGCKILGSILGSSLRLTFDDFQQESIVDLTPQF